MQLPEPNFGSWLERVVAEFDGREVLRRRTSKQADPRSYRQFAEEVRAAGEAFAAMGVKPGERVGLIADSRREWLVVDLALACQGAVDVPRGADSSNLEILTILAHSGSKGAVVDTGARADALVASMVETPALEFLIVLDGTAENVKDAHRTRIVNYDDFIARGRACIANGSTEFAARSKKVKPSDLLTLVYTSGTTGAPKGVQLTHGNVLSNMLGVRERLPIHAGDVVLSILPTWHMFERLVEYAVLDRGGCLVYTDTRRLRGDLTTEQPHLMATVPRIWEGLYAAIQEKLDKATPARRRIFRSALTAALAFRRARASGNVLLTALLWPFWALTQALVFGPVRTAAGLGRLNVCVSGGGSLPFALDEFFLALGVPLVNGYGLTETSPVLAVRRLEGNAAGSVGPPLAETEVKLVGLDGGAVEPGSAGVLRVHGPQVTPGYFHDQGLTDRAFPEPGWFDTGDLARIDNRGEIWIVGRAKDTIALRGGEKVEPERVESALKSSPLIQQSILVGQDAKNIAAIIVPNLERLAEAVNEPGLLQVTSETIDSEPARKAIRQEIDAIMTLANGFRPYERPIRFCLLRHAIDPSSGMMTATLKFKRRVIAERFATLIADLTRD